MNSFSNQLCPEEQLLLSLARIHFTGAMKEQICRLAEKITDWNYFVRLANEHGLIALSHNNLSTAGAIDKVPVKVAERLRSAYLISLSQNTKIYSLLEEIISIASKENIRVILLKGAVLEKTVYGNSGLRQMSDIDLLVKADDALPLRNLLLNNGFLSLPLISPLHEKLLPYLKSHLPVMHKNGISTEIHVRLFDEYNEDLVCEIINNPEIVPGTTPEMFSPPLQLHFLYLIKHLDRHARTKDLQLKLYTDIAVLIEEFSGQLLNANLIRLAEKAGLTEPLAEIVYLIDKFWDVNIPEPAVTLISGINAAKITGKFTGFLRNPSSYPRQDDSTLLFKSLHDIPVLTGKIRYVTGYFFPSLYFIKYKFRVSSRVFAIFYYPAWYWRILRMVTGRGK
ncbi:MAG: nucleotidyltransferase family protein [Bacteroidales bacterium]|nr:nucleotidyltransferase family protein [Bacteroidales bacterium]